MFPTEFMSQILGRISIINDNSLFLPIFNIDVYVKNGYIDIFPPLFLSLTLRKDQTLREKIREKIVVVEIFTIIPFLRDIIDELNLFDDLSLGDFTQTEIFYHDFTELRRRRLKGCFLLWGFNLLVICISILFVWIHFYCILLSILGIFLFFFNGSFAVLLFYFRLFSDRFLLARCLALFDFADGEFDLLLLIVKDMMELDRLNFGLFLPDFLQNLLSFVTRQLNRFLWHKMSFVWFLVVLRILNFWFVFCQSCILKTLKLLSQRFYLFLIHLNEIILKSPALSLA